jgi:hypothetical protein
MPTQVGISRRQRLKISTFTELKIDNFLRIEFLRLGDTDLRRHDGLMGESSQ